MIRAIVDRDTWETRVGFWLFEIMVVRFALAWAALWGMEVVGRRLARGASPTGGTRFARGAGPTGGTRLARGASPTGGTRLARGAGPTGGTRLARVV